MDKRLFTYLNWSLLLGLFALYLVGVGNLYSASGTRIESGLLSYAPFYQKQLIWGLCGLGCLLLTLCFDYRQLRNLAWPAYLCCLVLLMLVPLIGSTVYGAKRWISLGFMSLQPSEMTKLAVLVLTARLLSRDGKPLDWKNFSMVLAAGMLPVCVKTCPTGAMAFGERDEILALAKKRLEVVKKTHPKAFLADPDEVSVIYLLAEEAEFYHEYATFG